MLILAVSVIPIHADFGEFDAKDSLVTKISLSPVLGADSKRIEDRMDEALSGLDSLKSTKEDEKINSTRTDINNQNSSIQNSSLQNLSTNSSALNSSALNSSAGLSDLTEDQKLRSDEARSSLSYNS